VMMTMMMLDCEYIIQGECTEAVLCTLHLRLHAAQLPPQPFDVSLPRRDLVPQNVRIVSRTDARRN